MEYITPDMILKEEGDTIYYKYKYKSFLPLKLLFWDNVNTYPENF